MECDLPKIWGTGDVVILRNMKIKKFNGVTLVLSTYSSTWTVMHAPAIPHKVPTNMIKIPHEKETRAPTPTPSELQYVVDVCNYFERHSFTSRDAPTATSNDPQQTVAHITPAAPRQKFSLIKDVEIATYYDLVGQVVKIFPSNGKTDLYITDYSPNQLLYFYEWGQSEGGLEARDGDEFGYVSRSSKNAKKWPGPFGKLTLAVTLWSPHSEYAQQHVKDGDFVSLRNVHIRLDQDTKMVGSLHSDRRYPDRIDISVLTDFHDDDRVKDVLRRKKDYHQKFDQQSEKFVAEARNHKDTATTDANATKKEDVKPLSRNQTRNQRRKNKKAQLAQSKTPDENLGKRKRSDDVENGIPSSSCEDAGHKTAALLPPPPKAQKTDAKIAFNKYVKCSRHLTPITPLAAILSFEGHINKTPAGATYTLPFQNINSRASVKVIDFWPSQLENFAVPKKRVSEFAVLSDHEESESDSESESENEFMRDIRLIKKQNHGRESEADATSDGHAVLDRDERGWEWRFALLLEDATAPPSSTEPKPTLKAYVYGPDAECLLKLDAEDLHASPTALAALREKLFLLWGDLEERKLKQLERKASSLKEIGDNKQITGSKDTKEARRWPFQCCLKEYGVKVKSEDVESGDGSVSRQKGDPGLWERRWRLWGCTIT